jgi:HSP20 family protein
VKVEFSNGILTLTLPKLEAAKKRVVKINLTESSATAIASYPKQPDNSETGDVWNSSSTETAAV